MATVDWDVSHLTESRMKVESSEKPQLPPLKQTFELFLPTGGEVVVVGDGNNNSQSETKVWQSSE